MYNQEVKGSLHTVAASLPRHLRFSLTLRPQVLALRPWSLGDGPFGPTLRTDKKPLMLQNLRLGKIFVPAGRKWANFFS